MTVQDPGKYTKGKMGYLLDMRAAVGRMTMTTREWCRAFDLGDMKALERLGEQMAEVAGDIEHASASAAEAPE